MIVLVEPVTLGPVGGATVHFPAPLKLVRSALGRLRKTNRSSRYGGPIPPTGWHLNRSPGGAQCREPLKVAAPYRHATCTYLHSPR